ncbi:ADP-ribosylglycohydrolase family protein [Actinomadura craniellae]|nr:ADP-ribosylglycohydrolase family protein [Actinomadura craniellae]
MVNRTLELDLLKEHLARVIRGEPGHAVLLLGESGVGKSRLAGEAVAEADRLGTFAITAQCLGHGAEPLLPIRDAMAIHLGRNSESIRRTLTGAAPRLLDAIPFIGTFLGKLGETWVEGRQPRGASTEGVYEALAGVLIGISERHGLLLLVEDLHQADQDTLFFLNYLLRKIRGHRVLAVFTMQEERLRDVPQLADLVAQWTAEGYGVLTVLPLERAHVGEYVQMAAALGEPPDDKLVDRLFGLTGGNPFFLKETLQLLSAQDPPAGTEPVSIPPRVDAVLRRRLGRADTQVMRFLEAAAVVVETAQEIEPVAHVMDADLAAAIQALTAACELRLMREGANGEIGFIHALMQRAVYQDMGANSRRFLHSRAAEWFEREGRFASAAFHFERAENIESMVRAALEAASHAEQAGMYHSALGFYQKARPYVEIEQIGPPLGRALITMGNWDQAQELIDQLPEDDGGVRLLRAELRFVRGDFHGARVEARAALDTRTAEALVKLADIELYLGEFPAAQEHVRRALDTIGPGLVPLRARCLGMLGATEFFAGDVDEGRTRFEEALRLLLDEPENELDVLAYATLLGNLGNVAEAQGDWAAAEQRHAEALRLRREVADARGALHSLHALGRCRIGLGDVNGGHALYAETERLAADLGEALERAKLAHTRGELRLRAGDPVAAAELVGSALEVFSRTRTHYDVTHARVTLAAATLATGRERAGVELAAAARASIESKRYGLLRRIRPETAYPLADRVAGALTAYACGDALGLPYEGSPPSEAAAEQIERLRPREGWAPGATSDDTALTMLVARHLVEREGNGAAHAFLELLAAQDPPVPGMGPSTTAAIEHFRRTGRPPESGGTSNGAPMRALPVGWATPLDAPDRRRQLALEMTRATHPDPDAACAAGVVAACASWALEGASPRLLLEVAVEEERAAAREYGAGDRLAGLLAELAAGRWRSPDQGIGLDPGETVTAALSCVLEARDLRDGLLRAVRLGGDTDTVAAITGGLLGSRLTRAEVFAVLPWHVDVRLPEVVEVSAGLAAVRAEG